MAKSNGVEVCPKIPDEQWHVRYPLVDREYVWIYPLIRGDAFDPRCMFEPVAIPRPSLDAAVYIHVPACLFHCPMCVFYKEIVSDASGLDWYAEALVREFELHMQAPGSRSLGLRTIYFGGGTATLLSPEAIARIISAIKNGMPCSREEPEVTLEGHPVTVTEAYLKAVAEVGVNRVSFGVQSFDSASLQLLGMRQTREDNLRAIAWAKQAGIRSVSIDILYRLPEQTPQSVVEQLRIAYDLGVNSISTYSLEPSAAQERIRSSQPSIDQDRAMFYAIHDEMHERGWVHVAQPDYAAPGFENDELLVSWGAPQGQNLSLGAGAWGVFNGAVYCNVHDLAEYRRVLEAGFLPVLAGSRMTMADAETRYPVLGARCFFMPGEPFRVAFGTTLVSRFSQEIDMLQRQGLVEVSGEDLVVTRKGKYYVDNISKTFYAPENRGHMQPWGLFYRGATAPSYFRPPTSSSSSASIVSSLGRLGRNDCS